MRKHAKFETVDSVSCRSLLGGAFGTLKMAAIEQWVVSATAPKQILASHLTNGNVDRTGPLCPYAQVATYKGTGSTDDAANFVCKAP
jgi:hypothetical protein